MFEDIAPLKSGMRVGLIDADLDIAVFRDALMAKVISVVWQAAFFKLGLTRVGVAPTFASAALNTGTKNKKSDLSSW